jgi:hypothetical protein
MDMRDRLSEKSRNGVRGFPRFAEESFAGRRTVVTGSGLA